LPSVMICRVEIKVFLKYPNTKNLEIHDTPKIFLQLQEVLRDN
jgi:hypothetical protein